MLPLITLLTLAVLAPSFVLAAGMPDSVALIIPANNTRAGNLSLCYGLATPRNTGGYALNATFTLSYPNGTSGFAGTAFSYCQNGKYFTDNKKK